MAKIYGNTVTTPMPVADWNQTDESKADYIKNKPQILTEDDIVNIIKNSGGGNENQITEPKEIYNVEIKQMLGSYQIVKGSYREIVEAIYDGKSVRLKVTSGFGSSSSEFFVYNIRLLNTSIGTDIVFIFINEQICTLFIWSESDDIGVENIVLANKDEVDALSDVIDTKQNKTDDSLLTENKTIPDAINEVYAIAKGRATGYVFDTVTDMNNWLSDSANTVNLVLGDNLYIKDTDVSDYWWDGMQAQPLETQKVDLTEYANKATTLAGYGISDAYTKTEVDNLIGNIDSTLDELHNYAQALIGGAS